MKKLYLTKRTQALIFLTEGNSSEKFSKRIFFGDFCAFPQQETGNKRSYGEGDALLSSMLSCSGLLNPRNVACLQKLACEAYSVDTDLPELEMQVLRM
jgi:hypothetical protein